MGYLLFGIALAVGAYVAFVIFLRIIAYVGMRTNVRDMGRYFPWVIGRGQDGSLVRFRRPGTRYRVEFEKFIPPPSSGRQARFRMVLDSRWCSEAEFERTLAALGRGGVDFEVWREPTGEYRRLFVECGPDPTKATRAARAVFMEGFGFNFETPLRVTHAGEFDVHVGANPMAGWEEDRAKKHNDPLASRSGRADATKTGKGQ